MPLDALGISGSSYRHVDAEEFITNGVIYRAACAAMTAAEVAALVERHGLRLVVVSCVDAGPGLYGLTYEVVEDDFALSMWDWQYPIRRLL